MFANTSMEVILTMLFFTFSDTNIRFVEQKLTWRSYITAEDLSATKKVKLIDKKKFAKVALDENSVIFVENVAAIKTQEPARMLINLSQTTQISQKAA